MSLFPDRHVIEQLINGHYADPFSLLGLHITEQGLQIRALLPGAWQVSLVDSQNGQSLVQLNCEDDRGFFVATVPQRHEFFRYQLAVTWPGGQQLIEDPYRFGLLLQELDSWLLAEGTHLRPFERLGAHLTQLDDVEGTSFTLWAPNARRVSVVGEFNAWDGRRHPMRLRQESGLWELFLPAVGHGHRYKYEIITRDGQRQLKADPYAFAAQLRPETASVIAPLPDKVAEDSARQLANQTDQPIAIYEVHLGSWRRQGADWLSYQQLAEQLIPYVKALGFTHIELLPISEYPFDGSWGYQTLGLYAPTSRYGSPEQLKAFITTAHQAGLNVILDWVPGHFPSDGYGLAQFDGSALYEYADPREGFHQDWNTLIYNYRRLEVRNFLTGNAFYWLERFGLDGLRVDAVASMIARDYSRAEGQWLPNEQGGNENLEAISFLRNTNQIIRQERPSASVMAEDSTDSPGVTQAPEQQGLGFHFKWNLGWMHDTLNYMTRDPLYRRYHHQDMTFGLLYAHSEHFILPLSHDEVVHGKGSLISRMPGDRWQQFANLRAYYGFMWAYPGKKLLFMGGEFAQWREWDFDSSLDWYLLDDPASEHRGVQRLVADLNHCYRSYPALSQWDSKPEGFQWLVVDDNENSVFAFARQDASGQQVIAISNFTPVPRYNYRIGIEKAGIYREIINTDSVFYQGSNIGNLGLIHSQPQASHHKPHSLSLALPPLATIYLLQETP